MLVSYTGGRAGVMGRAGWASRGGALVVVVALCTTTWLTSSAGAADAPSIGATEVIRHETSYDYNGCLAGFDLAGRRIADIPNQVRVYANGVLMQDLANDLETSVPYSGADPHPCIGPGLYIGFGGQLELADLYAAGVTQPATDSWTAFVLRVEVDIDGHSMSREHVVDIGRGDPIGAISWMDASPKGARLHGWAVDPESSAGVPLVVTVDGRYYPYVSGLPADPPTSVVAQIPPGTTTATAEGCSHARSPERPRSPWFERRSATLGTTSAPPVGG